MYSEGSFWVPRLRSMMEKETRFTSAISSDMLPVVSTTKESTDDCDTPTNLREKDREGERERGWFFMHKQLLTYMNILTFYKVVKYRQVFNHSISQSVLPQEVFVPRGQSDVLQELHGGGDGHLCCSQVQVPMARCCVILVNPTNWILITGLVKRTTMAALSCSELGTN